MSTAVGIVHKKEIWLGADGLATTEAGHIRNFNAVKIFKNKDYTFAYIGSVRGGQIFLENSFTPPKDIKDLPDKMFTNCENKSCLITDDDGAITQQCNFLIVYKNKLYEMHADFQLNQIHEYTSIGHGCNIAMGSLFTTEELKYTPKERIEIALKAASRFSNATGPPFLIVKCD